MGASRRFMDSYGFQWLVSEIERDRARENRASVADVRTVERGWLYFFSRGCTLVLTRYPDDWSSASWEDLEVLCRKAIVLGQDVHSIAGTLPSPLAPRDLTSASQRLASGEPGVPSAAR